MIIDCYSTYTCHPLLLLSTAIIFYCTPFSPFTGRTELSEQYVFSSALQSQLVLKLQQFWQSLDLACVQHRVDVRFYNHAQQVFRLRAALKQYVFPLRFILSQYCDGKLVRSLHWHCIFATSEFAVLLHSAAQFWSVEEPFDKILCCFLPSVDNRRSVCLHRFFRAPMQRCLAEFEQKEVCDVWCL